MKNAKPLTHSAYDLAGTMSHWVVITWPNDASNDYTRAVIGADNTSSLLLGVLHSDKQKRFANYRPICTSAILGFELQTMSIFTENSKYELSGPGIFLKTSLNKSESLISHYSKKISTTSRKIRKQKIVH